MRLSSLCVAAVLLLSPMSFAQHSSGGGGGGSSGGSSGGGSHGGSSGGSSYSGSSGGGHSSNGSNSSSSTHSSGGSGSHGSSGHGSNGHGSNGLSSASSSSHSNVSPSHSNSVHSVREPNTNVRTRTETTEKKGFFTFLRHPFRKPEPKPDPRTKPVADLRRPICFKGPCPVCPVGQARTGGGCMGTTVVNHARSYCTSGEIWRGGDCLLHTRFLDDCSGLRAALQQQAQRMQQAELERQNACAAGATQTCTDLTTAAQSESGLYRTLQDRYRMCTQRSMTTYPSGGYGNRGYSGGAAFEPRRMELSFP